VTTPRATSPSAEATNAPPAPARPDERWGVGRTETFSDGVFAIAITPLILQGWLVLWP
jgi:hypothetical protein